MSKLSIIIPQYSESEEQMKALLFALDNQSGVDFFDFEVVIVNDASETLLSDEFIGSFKNLQLKYLKLKKNGGPGVARQHGIDNTDSDYIMFIDADDLIYSYLSIYSIFEAFKTEADVYRFKFKSEVADEYGFQYHYESNNLTWLHGKIYSREVLDSEGIRFPNIRINEDGYFNTLVFTTPGLRIIDIDEDLLIWKYNLNSITRSEKDIRKSSDLMITTYIDSNKLLFKELLKRKRIEALVGKLNHTLINTFITMQNPDLQGAEFIYRIRAELKGIYKKYTKYIKQILTNDFIKMYADTRAEQGNFIERESYLDFAKWLAE